MITLWLVIPCYNEQEVLPISSGLFLQELNGLIEAGKISDDSRILFVNDGSTDTTWDVIRSLARQDRHFVGISQSRNRGHQNALYAGMMEAKQYADAVITVDCDGQDDIRAISAMVDEHLKGNDVVYGVRSSRETDTFFKRFTAQCFYRVMQALGADTVYNHADYRLASRRVLEALSDFREVNLYLRGIFPLIGFKSSVVYYERYERIAGETHYPLHKMIALALDGIVGMSDKLLEFVFWFGVLFSAVGCIGTILSLILYAVRVWTFVPLLMLFMLGLCGVLMVCLGIVGEYVGKTYLETKARPRYIISARTWEEK